MSKNEIILIGGGGHCKSCIEVIESTNEYTISGIIDTKDKVGTKILDYNIIGSDDDLTDIFKDVKYALITVGQIKNSEIRFAIYNNLKSIGYKLPIIIASTAYVSNHSSIGEGTIIMHQCFINAGTTIGYNNIVNTKAMIEHDVTIGNHNHISTHTTLNGNVSIGDKCFIGSNTSFVNGVEIKDNIFIGIGSLVSKNIETPGIYVGSPVKKIR